MSLSAFFGCNSCDSTYIDNGFAGQVEGNVGTNITGIEIKEPSSLLKPTLVLKYSDFETILTNNYNYCYISKFNRYYFMGDPVIQTGGRVEIPCTVDALYSFRDELYNCECFITRTGRPADWSSMLTDTTLPVTNKTVSKQNIKFDKTPFAVVDASAPLGELTYNYILTVVGGGQANPPTP